MDQSLHENLVGVSCCPEIALPKRWRRSLRHNLTFHTVGRVWGTPMPGVAKMGVWCSLSQVVTRRCSRRLRQPNVLGANALHVPNARTCAALRVYDSETMGYLVLTGHISYDLLEPGVIRVAVLVWHRTEAGRPTFKRKSSTCWAVCLAVT